MVAVMMQLIICIQFKIIVTTFFLSDNLNPKAYSFDNLNETFSLRNVKGTGCFWRGWPKLILRDNITQWCMREQKRDQQDTSNITVLLESNHHVCGVVGNLLSMFCFRVRSYKKQFEINKRFCLTVFCQRTIIPRSGVCTAVFKYRWTSRCSHLKWD